MMLLLYPHSIWPHIQKSYIIALRSKNTLTECYLHGVTEIGFASHYPSGTSKPTFGAYVTDETKTELYLLYLIEVALTHDTKRKDFPTNRH